MLHIEYCERIDQLMNDGKGEIQAFEIAAGEFVNKIESVTLHPLSYLFIDGSKVTFKETGVYFSL